MVAEKTVKKFRGPLFSAAPCTFGMHRLPWRIDLHRSTV